MGWSDSDQCVIRGVFDFKMDVVIGNKATNFAELTDRHREGRSLGCGKGIRSLLRGVIFKIDPIVAIGLEIRVLLTRLIDNDPRICSGVLNKQM